MEDIMTTLFTPAALAASFLIFVSFISFLVEGTRERRGREMSDDDERAT
jgi:hypothetical protein